MIGDALYQIRAQRQMTAPDFAGLIGVSPSMLSRMEQGSRIPRVRKLVQILGTLEAHEALLVLQEVGMVAIDPLAVEVNRAVTGSTWSESRKDAFRNTVMTMMRTAS